MWSLDAVVFQGFKPQPSLNASLTEFIADLQRVAPFHSGFHAKLSLAGDVYTVKLLVECGTYFVEQEIESKQLFEALYFAFQATYAKILEHENTKVQAIQSAELKRVKKYVS